MSAWRRHQFVTSTQTARTRLAPTFVLVKRVLRVTVIPVKVNDQKNIDWTKTLVTSVSFLLPLFEMVCWVGAGTQWYHLFVLCCFIFNNLTTIEASGTSFVTGCTLYKTGGHLSKEITINNCSFLCRCRSFNPSLCRLSPFLLPRVAVSRPFRFSVEI